MKYVIVVVLLAGFAALAIPAEPAQLVLNANKRELKTVPVEKVDPVTGKKFIVRESVAVSTPFRVTIDPTKTAVVVCDMWDDHWCKSAASRCAELAKAANPVLKACREKGMTIIHCPSDCMKYYEDHAARKRMLAVKKVEPPKAKDLPNPPLPVDDSDGGCDDEKPAKQFKAWTRQHEAIEIDADKDYITDNGVEVYSLMEEKKITYLIVMGVHTNMCVLNRTFAIKQMVKWGKNVFLVRDITDAMYNPKMKPMVNHKQGTELIIEFIEQNWCPTLESKELLSR
jgi:nicotinamidase-related amidase